jgi:hypothetical protein
VIENIKAERDQAAKNYTTPSEAVAKELLKAESALETHRAKWRTKRAEVESLHTLSLKKLNMEHEISELEFNEKWSSPSTQTRFNKPSPKLIAMRQHAHALLIARDFDGASSLAGLIRKIEDDEATEASNRMLQEYKLAHDRLDERFDIERRGISRAYEAKLSTVVVVEAREVQGLEKRIRYLTRAKEFADIETKRLIRRVQSAPVKRMPVAGPAEPIIPLARLALAPLRTVTRVKRIQEDGLEVAD